MLFDISIAALMIVIIAVIHSVAMVVFIAKSSQRIYLPTNLGRFNPFKGGFMKLHCSKTLFPDSDLYRINRVAISALFLITVALILGGCATMPKEVVRIPSYTISDTENTALGQDIKPLLVANPGMSGFYALSEGTDAFAARLILIGDAQKSIDVQYYIWHDDLTGKVMHNGLLVAADRGVRVRLLLDDLDTAGKEETLRYLDAHPNIEVRLFNAFPSRKSRTGGFVSDFGRLNHRMHNKTITMDNQATIFGGRNIGDEYFDAAEEVAFSDLDALAIGPVVNEVSEQFDLYWNSEWTYPLAAFKTKLLISDEKIAAFRKESDSFLKQASETGYANAIRGLRLAKTASTQDMDFQWGRWKLVYDHPSKVEASEVKITTHLAPNLKIALDRAEKEILIVSPYFVPGKKFTAYLAGRVDSGVRVRILTNSLAANDVAVVFAGYSKYRKDLIKGGVELYEFKATREFIEAQEDKKTKKGPWKGSSRSSLHAKYFAFDQQYVFIGSFNLDGRSVAINTELGVYFESPLYASMIHDGFDNQILSKAYRVVLNEKDKIEWISQEQGKEVRYSKEPDTSFWKRFSTGFSYIFVPESQL